MLIGVCKGRLTSPGGIVDICGADSSTTSTGEKECWLANDFDEIKLAIISSFEMLILSFQISILYMKENLQRLKRNKLMKEKHLNEEN
ncbi:hypothetical protein IEQ34_006173 [Dendrobium chrysotoxum]|uniref:Uncharacterized protein n=1 Tax=Dendrobium chrysotoxum TaxID=161865 RepID=A0AAV7HF67_DENCH|nr:hypothetical protein IEQ34_006173 [Dendrobium chrysotoxum]